MNRYTGHLAILLLALVTTAASERGPLTAALWLLAGLVAALLVMAGTSAVLHHVGRRRVR